MEQAYVVSEQELEGRTDDGDTALTKISIDSSSGSERLEQHVIRFGPGRSRPRTQAGRQAVLYVANGSGTLDLEGASHQLEPDTGVFVAAGETYTVTNPGPGDLLLVGVVTPAEDGSPGGARRVTVRYVDQPPLQAGTDREFRYLVNQDAGCLDVTQFVGVIPPGRAPMHSHTYDEVIYVIEGEGVLHVGDRRRPIAAGSCIHLPPLLVHCLENSGIEPLRVLGVFHPSGDPASRAYDAAGASQQ